MNRSPLLLTSLVLLICSLPDCVARAQSTVFVPTCVGDASFDTAKFAAIKTRVGPTSTGTIKIPYAANPAHRCKLDTFVTGDNIILDNTKGSGVFVVTGETLTAGPIINPPDKQIFYNALGGQGKVSSSLKEVYPQWWGAKGDWNGSAGTDNLAPFTATIAAIPSTGGTFKLVPGDYRLSDGWEITKSNITIETTPGSVIRTTTNTTGGETVAFRGPGGVLITNVHIRGGGTVTNSSPAAVHGNGIGFTACRNWSAKGMRLIDGTRHAITAQEDVFDGEISGNYIDGWDYAGIGVSQKSSTTLLQLKNVIITNNIIRNTGTGVVGASVNAGLAAIYVDAMDDAVISNNIIDTVLGDTHGRGINVQTSAPGVEENNRVSITGNIIRTTNGPGIFAVGVKTLNLANNEIKNSLSHGVYIEASKDVSLSNNQSLAPAGRGITLVNVAGAIRINGDTVKTSGEDGIFITGASMTSLNIQATIEGAGGADPAGLTYAAVYIGSAPVINKVNVLITGIKHRYAVRNDGKNPLLISGSVTPGNVVTFVGPVTWSRSSLSGAPWLFVDQGAQIGRGRDAFKVSITRVETNQHNL